MGCEKTLRDNNINIIVIPTPTIITKSCGIAIRFKSEDINEVIQIINREKLIFQSIYKKEESGYGKLYWDEAVPGGG